MTVDPLGIGHLYSLRPDPLWYLTAAAWAVGPLAEREFELAHRDCDLSTFCRNPLHPGPCKGWKKHLGLVAPGALHALERIRHDKLEAARKAKVKALQDAGHPVPKKLLQPITYDPAKNKHIGEALQDPDLKKLVEQPITAPTKKAIEQKLEVKHAGEKAAADAAAAEAAAKEAAEKAKLTLVHQTLKQAGLKHGDVAMYKGPGVDEPTLVKVRKTTNANQTVYSLTNQDGKDVAHFGAATKRLFRKATSEETKGFLAKEKADKDAASAKVVEAAKKAGPSQVKQMSEPKAKTSSLAEALKSGKNAEIMEALDANPDEFDKLTSAQQDEVAGKLHTEAMMGLKYAQDLIKKLDIPDPGTASGNPNDAIPLHHPSSMLLDHLNGTGSLGAKGFVNTLAKLSANDLDQHFTPEQREEIKNDLISAHAALGASSMADSPETKSAITKAKFLLGHLFDLDPETAGKTTALTNGGAGSLSTNALGNLVNKKASNTEVMIALNTAPELFDDLTPEQKHEVKMALAAKALLGDDDDKALASKLLQKHGLADAPKSEPKAEPDVLGELLNNVGNSKYVPTGAQPAHVQTAIAMANGHKSAHEKMKLAAYQKVTPDEFESLDPNTQKLILANLTGMQKKFVDPKKVQAAHELHTKLSGAAGGGAGAGGKPDATFADPMTPTHELMATKGADAMTELGELTGVEVTPSMHSGIKQVIEKLHKNGNTGVLLDNYAQGPAEALATALEAKEPTIPASLKPVFEDALKTDVYHQMVQDGTKTPLLDAVKSLMSVAPGKNPGPAKLQVLEALKAHPSMLKIGSGEAETPAKSGLDGLLEHAGETELPGHVDAADSKQVSTWLGTHSLNNAFVDAGLGSDSIEQMDDLGLSDKLEKTLVQGYEMALDNFDSKPGGLAGQLPGIAKKVAEAGDTVAMKNGWAPDSKAVESYKNGLFLSMAEAAMVGKPEGAGGSATSAPSAVVSEVKKAVNPDGSLTTMQKATLKQAYKSLGGTYLKEHSAQENFDALNAVASLYAGKEGIGKLTFGQVMDAVDEILATEVQSPNAGLLRKKIEEFLATPGGKAYVTSASPKTNLVATLTGKMAEAAEAAEWKNGKTFPKYPGPGPFVAKHEGEFKAHYVASSKELHDATLKKLGKKITPEQKEALVHYSGSGASEMNGWLRTGSSGYGLSTIKQAHAVEEAMYPIQEDMRLLRRTGWEFVPKEYRSLEGIQKLIGGTFKDDGFMSTTMAMQPGQYGKGVPVELDIEAPKGTRGFHLDHWSQFKGVENEFLLGAGQVMQVMDAYKQGNKVIVRVRVVTP